ncbi:MAG: helix-turn-helix domain-containing protein [Chloroflexi bacterium]|jgi:DNA-binding XRE family transcriptional regulator|nr:helix-turn-helix domain-containing protein [Chloroflexota bacterium]MBT7082577.1 helix-turn-helix domain-containing protein [Chloroflexota bacterium]MBT7289122.1 helix-turn-helix domain-containing protein [Chloroflexota bacterium]
MDKEEFTKIRNVLGKTQEQLSQLLCVSVKAVQSYEQGWRTIPSNAERQMMLFLAFKNRDNMSLEPCWEIKDCPDEWRSNCIVWELKIRHLCWFINGTFCQGKIQSNWNSKIKICRDCDIYKQVFPHDLMSNALSTEYSI